MQAWQWFWSIWLLVAGVAFAAITLVVTIKGFGDVRRLLRGLERE